MPIIAFLGEFHSTDRLLRILVKHVGLEPTLFRIENPVTQPVSRMLRYNINTQYIEGFRFISPVDFGRSFLCIECIKPVTLTL